MILVGDCFESLKSLSDGSVQCCVTSPPYFGLRDYGIDGQIGLEADPQAYVDKLVALFSEVKRVLRDDGTLWLNLGDSYAGSWGARGRGENTNAARPDLERKHGTAAPNRNGFKDWGVKPKDRMMIPARVALALQQDGWWLRDEIIWNKPNPTPSSVEDRTTPCHEMLYMFAKSKRYFFDFEAIREPAVSDHKSGNGFKRPARLSYQNSDGSARGNDAQWTGVGGLRRKRSVWTVPTRPFKEAHFATFPPDLIEPCILAGCPEGGTVLDPFFGAGTTGLVARQNGRQFIGCELNPDYVVIAERRLASVDVPPVHGALDWLALSLAA